MASSCVKTFLIPSASAVQPAVWWKLEEQNQDDRVDAVAGMILQALPSGPNGLVFADTGIIGFGTRFGVSGLSTDPASSSSLENNTGDTVMDYTGNGFTFTSWFMTTAFDNCRAFLIEYDFVGGAFRLIFDKVGNVPGPSYLTASLNGAAILQESFTPQLGLWYFIRTWYDQTTGKIGIQIDNGTKNESVSTEFVGAGANTSMEVRVQADDYFLDYSMDITVDEINFFPAVISDASATFLYNGGAGQTWPIVVP